MKNLLSSLVSLILLSQVPLILHAQPVNDDCSGATAVFLGSNPIDTTQATTSTEPIPDSTCPGSTLGQVLYDAWFQFAVPETGFLTISTCDTVNFDTDVIVYTGSCDSLLPTACYGDSSDCFVQGTTNSWNTIVPDLPVTQGDILKIRIGGWGSSDQGTGTFDLSLSSPPPPPLPISHDECLDAFPAEIGNNPVNSIGATTSPEPYSTATGCTSQGQMTADVWFRWVAPEDGFIHLSTCDTVNFDTDLMVYSGECDDLQEVACSGDEPNCFVQGSTTQSWNSHIDNLAVTAGEILHFRIGGWGANDYGTGDLVLEFVTDVIAQLEGNSVPGSYQIDASVELSGDCSALLFSVGSESLEVLGPFSTGQMVNAQISSPSIQTMATLCVTPLFGQTLGVQQCTSVAVLSPILYEACSSPGTTIPDSGEPVEIPIVVAGSPDSNIWDLQVQLVIDHPDASDLQIQLTDPNGTTELLHNLPAAAAGSGLDLTWWMNGPEPSTEFSDGGYWQPTSGNLFSFTGLHQPGVWTLSVSDEISGNTGIINEVCLKFFDTVPLPVGGQDLIMGNTNNTVYVGREGSIASFGMESVICNGGDEPLNWYANPDPRHPMMVFNMFRVDEDRILQIGGSWAKHGWSSAQANACGFGCQPSSTNQQTGIGCSDTYGAAGNAAQINMGPRSEINPWGGGFVWDGSYMSQDTGPWNETEERLSIEDRDLDPAQNVGSTYLAEVYVIQPSDVDTSTNRAWEPVGISGTPGDSWSIDMSAVSENSPIQNGWPGSEIVTVSPPANIDGTLDLAYKVTENTDGTWRYEYAIYNFNFSAGIGSFKIPVDPSVNISATRFYAPVKGSPFHSDDPWVMSHPADEISWSTPGISAGLPSNPLTWGWMHNFGFDADAPPVQTIVTLESHSASPFGVLEVMVLAPPPPPPAAIFLRGYCNGDGALNIADPIFLLGHLFSNQADPDCPDACDVNDDGSLNIADAISLLNNLICCSQTVPPPPGPTNCGEDPTDDDLGCTTNTNACP